MEREDIIAGLKQAVSRGESLEKAKLSFINAGYPEKDVEDSANAIKNSVSSIEINLPTIQTPNQKARQELPKIPRYDSVKIQQPVQKPIQLNPYPIPQPTQNIQQQITKTEKSNKKIIILSIILLILLAALGFSIFLMKNKGINLDFLFFRK